MTVDVSNAAQAAAWDGGEGAYWAAHADRFDRSVAGYQERFMAAARIRAGSAVLDIGCGTGETTRAAARLARTGSAVGIGAMFFGDPARAFANVARALRPGSPLTLLTWQPPAGNEWIGAFARALAGGPPPAPPPGAPGPFSLSDPSVVRAVLAPAGFVDIEVTGVSAQMYFGRDVDEAHTFVLGLLGWMLDGRDEAGRRAATDDLRAALADHLTPDGVAFASATWLVTAQRDRRLSVRS